MQTPSSELTPAACELTPFSLPIKPDFFESTSAFSLRLFLATGMAKLSSGALKLTGTGAGTSLPGKIVRKLAPDVLTRLGRDVRRYRLGVTGTNGKTTTCGLLAQALREAGQTVAHNQMGANMVPGITAALVHLTDCLGRLTVDTAVLEVDEASLRRLTAEIPLEAVLVTNLFRDQLDRYGELDTTAQLIREGAGPHTPLVLNADDPLVAAMAHGRLAVWRFGVDAVTFAHSLTGDATESGGNRMDTALVPFASEVHQCPVCGQGPLQYTQNWYGHLGHFSCPDCQYARCRPDVYATVVTVTPEGSHIALTTPVGNITLFLPLPGLFNVYNLLAAATVALLAGVPLTCLQPAIDNLAPVFGRAEYRVVNGKPVRVMLIKNPVGATEVLRCVAGDPNARLLIALNDNDADGRDVSWIWDAAFELIPLNKPVTVTGVRAADMAVRLKYAGLPETLINTVSDLTAAIQQALAGCKPDETLYILPTYTVLLKLRTLWETL